MLQERYKRKGSQMKKRFLTQLLVLTTFAFGARARAEDYSDTIRRAEEMFEATRIACSGISDEISKVSTISKANTAVTAVGTVAATGALAVGIKKSQEEEEIDKIIDNCAHEDATHSH